MLTPTYVRARYYSVASNSARVFYPPKSRRGAIDEHSSVYVFAFSLKYDETRDVFCRQSFPLAVHAVA